MKTNQTFLSSIRRLMFLSVLLSFAMSLAAQDGGPITLEKKRYVQSGQVLKAPDFKTLLATNPATSADYQAYKTNSTIGGVFLATGGICVCATGALMLASSIHDAQALDEGDLDGVSSSYAPTLLLAGAGLAAVIVSVPFSLKAKKHLGSAVDAYNAGLAADHRSPVEFKLQVGVQSLGLAMRF